MTDKFKIESDESFVLQIYPDEEIYFSLKDINQEETMVSISEIYRVLRNVETLLGKELEDEIEPLRLAEDDWFESVGTE